MTNEEALKFDKLMKALESILYFGPSTGSLLSDEHHGNEFLVEINRVRNIAATALFGGKNAVGR